MPRSRYMETLSAPSYEMVRQILACPYRHFSDEEIEVLLEGAGVSPEDLEGFFSDLGRTLGRVGRQVGQVLPGILPTVGTVVGTAVGGPVGAAIGGGAGTLLGSVLTNVTAPSPAQRPAATQLLQVMLRPEVMQALIALILGQAGRPTVRVGGTPGPLGAFANLIGQLANQAAVEYNARVGSSGEAVPAHLEWFDGVIYGDITRPEVRAARLLTMLQETDDEWEYADEGFADEEEADDWEAMPTEEEYFSEMERIDFHMSAIMPLLTRPGTAELKTETGTLKVFVDKDDPFSILLPLLLMGMGGQGATRIIRCSSPRSLSAISRRPSCQEGARLCRSTCIAGW